MKQSLSSVDETVKVPAAIRAAAAQADELFKAAYNNPIEESNVEASTGAEEVTSESNSSAETFQTPAKELAPEAKTEVRDENKSDEDQSWEHRYKSMKGRFDRSQDQIRQMSEQITNLQLVVSNLEMRAPDNTPQNYNKDLSERLITAEEENDYGAEFLSVVGKKAREEMLPIVKGYEDKISRLEAQLQGVNGHFAQNAKQSMLSDLDERVANWRDVNKQQEFLEWLELPDLYSGAIRHELLKAAYERNNAPQVAAFFNGFLAEEAAMRPAGSAEATNGAQRRAPAVDPASLAAPGRAKSAASASAPAEKPFFTGAQIAKFYAEVASGKFRGNEAEKDRIEAQIFEATRNKRVR
jgi:hypothetical protein